MPKQFRSTRRAWRTRPSEVRAGIIMGDVDFFEAHRNSTFREISIGFNDDSSYELRCNCLDKTNLGSTIVQQTKKHKRRNKVKKSKKKKQPLSPTDLVEYKKLNAVFNDADDFSFIIENVVEDDYVMPATSSENKDNVSCASSSFRQGGIVCGNESTVWYYEDRARYGICSTNENEHFLTSPILNNRRTSVFPPIVEGNFENSILETSHSSTSLSEEEKSHCAASDDQVVSSKFKRSNQNRSVEDEKSLTLDETQSFKSLDNKCNNVLSEGGENLLEASQRTERWSINDSLPNIRISILPFSNSKFVTSTPKFRATCSSSYEPAITSNASIAALGITKNASQLLAVENPLKLFYYLREFSGDPTDINYLLHACAQTRVYTWDEFLPPGSLDRCKKLGEGVYGEVFKTSINDVSVALKIIPFLDKECTFDGLVNGERMKHTLEILPELLITKDLSELANENREPSIAYSCNTTPNFVRLVQAAVIKGNYPNELLMEWDRFANVTKRSENDRPDIYASKDQLFIALALSLGGRDLESYNIRNEKEAFSIFFQIALSLAVAEEVLEFEHRDLHVGNVLIGQCKGNETIRDEWKSFTPFTNILWLHYIATKVFASKKIMPKRRKEILAQFDRIFNFERIKLFLEDDAVLAIFEDFVIKDE